MDMGYTSQNYEKLFFANDMYIYMSLLNELPYLWLPLQSPNQLQKKIIMDSDSSECLVIWDLRFYFITQFSIYVCICVFYVCDFQTREIQILHDLFKNKMDFIITTNVIFHVAFNF